MNAMLQSQTRNLSVEPLMKLQYEASFSRTMARRGRFQPLGALLWFAAGAAAQTCASVAFAERIVTTLQDGAHAVFAIITMLADNAR